MNKEATYVFEYKGLSAIINAYVDPIEQRRYYTSPSNGRYPDNPMQFSTNYKGTGSEHATYHPSVIYEAEPFDYPSQKQCTNILFYLEDVSAYVHAFYDILAEDGMEIPEFSIVKFLEKLPN